MKRTLFLFCFVLVAILSGCSTLAGPSDAEMRIAALTAENQELTDAYEQLRDRFEELDEALLTTGFLKPQVIVEPAIISGGGDTLDQVLGRSKLRCGINSNAPGLGYLDVDTAQVSGFDIDFCRAVAAAVFGAFGADQIEPVAVTNRSRFPALQSGEIDLLIRNTTWTLTRDGAFDLDFVSPTLYDGAGIMVPNDSNVQTLAAMAGEKVCVLNESTTASAVTRYFAARDDTIDTVAFGDEDSARAAYERGACAGLSNDKTRLVGERLLLAEPDEHIILRSEMSREPLGPVIRQDDGNWRDVVNWVVQCTLNAELLGVDQQNARSMRENSDDIDIQRLLGTTGELGVGLGLENDFCYQVISQVGNYGEIYARNFGPGTPYSLPRGLNALFLDGGLHYPLPFQ